MSWDTIPHSWVLIAKEVEGNFYKMIKVGNRRLNITVLMNLQIRLPCQVMLDFYAPIGPTQGQWKGSQFSFLGIAPGCCWASFQVLACSTAPAWCLCDYPGPGAGPLSWTSPHSQPMLQTFLYSQWLLIVCGIAALDPGFLFLIPLTVNFSTESKGLTLKWL